MRKEREGEREKGREMRFCDVQRSRSPHGSPAPAPGGRRSFQSVCLAVAVAVIAVVPWLRLRLRLWGSSHGAKHLPSKQPGLWEGGAGCESRDGFGGRAGAKTVAASVAEGSSGAGGCTSSTTSSSSSSSSSSSDSDSESDSGGHRDGAVSGGAAHPGGAGPSPAQMALNNQELQFLGWDGAEEI